MRVTPDSGILVRGSASPTGPAARLIAELARLGLRIIISEYVLAEVRRALSYPRLQARYGLTTAEIDARIEHLRSVSEIVEPAVGPPIVLGDPKDDPVVYTAIAGEADVLCTLDRHFYAPNVAEFLGGHGVRVLSDVELLRELLLGRGKGHSV